MNKYIETNIINSFFVDNRKDRAKYELFSSKKRREFIWKLSENSFISKKVFLIKDSIPSYKKIEEILKKMNVPVDCYTISIDENIDGKILPLKFSLSKSVGFGPVIISCIHGKLAYFECEQSKGSPERYLLIDDKYIIDEYKK